MQYFSVEGPALDGLDHKVPALLVPDQGRVVEGGAGLAPALAQARVQPQPELAPARPHREAALS